MLTLPQQQCRTPKKREDDSKQETYKSRASSTSSVGSADSGSRRGSQTEQPKGLPAVLEMDSRQSSGSDVFVDVRSEPLPPDEESLLPIGLGVDQMDDEEPPKTPTKEEFLSQFQPLEIFEEDTFSPGTIYRLSVVAVIDVPLICHSQI